MNATVHILRERWEATPIFADRADAGRTLAEWIAPKPDPSALVFGLPRGGLPVARPLADALDCPLLPALVRKLPIPTDPEAGFGAVSALGTVRLNEPLVRALALSQAEIQRIAEEVLAEVRRRAATYPGGWPLPDLARREVWLVDDGLASGQSALAAADMLRSANPARLCLAVPCSPSSSLVPASASFDEVWCLAEQRRTPFAVASYYRDFHDLSDAEVLSAMTGRRGR